MNRYLAAWIACGVASVVSATPVPVVSYLQPLGPSVGNLSSIGISPDGRYLAFRQDNSTGSTNDIYLYDRIGGTATQINFMPAGGLPVGAKCDLPALSNEALYVVFACSSAPMGLPNSQGNGGYAYFVYNRLQNKTELIAQGTTDAIIMATIPIGISGDGRYAAYRTYKRLANGNQEFSLRLRDLVNKTDQVMPAASVYLAGAANRVSLSQDGRYISYSGKASATATTVSNMVFDRQTGISQPQEYNEAGVRGNSGADSDFPMSLDGKFVAFTSGSSNLVANPPTSRTGVYLRERSTGKIELITNPANNSFSSVALSADGRYVSYQQTGAIILEYDRLTKKTRSVSTQLANYGRLSGDGRYLAFQTNQGSNGSIRAIGLIDYGARPGVKLSATGLSLTEGGAAGTYSVVLNQVPDYDVTVSLKTDAQLSLARSQLVFTPANWNVPQIVSVQAVNDGVVQGAHTALVSNTATSNDIEYSVLNPQQVTVAISDAVVPTITTPGATWAQPDLPLTGTAAPNATVILTATNRTTGWLTSVTTVADAAGQWSYTLTGLADGVIELDAQADGIQSAVQTVTVALAQ